MNFLRLVKSWDVSTEKEGIMNVERKLLVDGTSIKIDKTVISKELGWEVED